MIRCTIPFSIEFLEHWHIGSGYGRAGDVDSTLYSENAPDGTLIPGLKTDELKGLLKEGCEIAIRIRQILSLESVPRLRQTQDFLFPVEDTADRAFLPSIDIILITSRISGVTKRMQTSIGANGQALPGSLRSHELGLPGTRFDLRLVVICPDFTMAKASSTLLVLGLKNIPDIGRRTSRGWGSARIDIGNEEILDLATSKRPVTLRPCKRYLVKIRLLDNTLFSTGPAVGNFIRTLDYLPGSGAFGMLRAGLKQCDGRDAGFEVGKISVSSFYPWSERMNGEGSLPLCLPFVPPLSLRKRKGMDSSSPQNAGSRIPFWVFSDNDSPSRLCVSASRDNAISASTPTRDFGMDKSFGTGFLWPCGTDPHEWFDYSPRISLENRNAIDLATGAVRKENGFFVEERMRKGTVLGGIVCSTSQGEELEKCLEHFPNGFVFHCGRGARPAELISITGLEDGELSIPAPGKPETNSDILTITLLSDCIIRSAQVRPGFAPGTITPALSGFQDALEPMSQTISVKLIDTWEYGKGARARDFAFRAGSVFVYRIIGSADALHEKLGKLQAEGLGARRDEGFGRIWINCPIHRIDWSTP